MQEKKIGTFFGFGSFSSATDADLAKVLVTAVVVILAAFLGLVCFLLS